MVRTEEEFERAEDRLARPVGAAPARNRGALACNHEEESWMDEKRARRELDALENIAAQLAQLRMLKG